MALEPGTPLGPGFFIFFQIPERVYGGGNIHQNNERAVTLKEKDDEAIIIALLLS